MNKYKFELLKCINKCPDSYVSKATIFNVTKWNYNKIDSVMQCLIDEKLVKTLNFEGEDLYTISSTGQIYINDFLKNKFKKIIGFIISIIVSFIISLFFFTLDK